MCPSLRDANSWAQDDFKIAKSLKQAQSESPQPFMEES